MLNSANPIAWSNAPQMISPNLRAGLGNDIIFLPNFAASFTADFKRKVYSDEEVLYCESFSVPLLRYASTFAAKEAVYKAAKQLAPSTPLLPWKRLEVLRDKPAGAPHINLMKLG